MACGVNLNVKPEKSRLYPNTVYLTLFMPGDPPRIPRIVAGTLRASCPPRIEGGLGGICLK